MLEVVLHTGIEHPNLLWILASSALAFGAGVTVGKYTANSKPNTESVVETE